MNDPHEAKKNYGTLFIQKSPKALLIGALLTTVCYVLDGYLMQQSTTTITYIFIFFITSFYYTWKQKFIRF